jgi:prevent-host-death family protein
MAETYSTYEAKARLSEILRKVARGRTIRISRRGEPIAEIRPLRREPVALEQRIRELRDQGVLSAPSPRQAGRLSPRRTGALRRFLAESSGGGRGRWCQAVNRERPRRSFVVGT